MFGCCKPTVSEQNTTMVVKLYKMDLSAPARAAMMACEVLNVPVQMIDVNLVEQEHLTPEYLKKNPVHTVPVLEAGDYILHDSHAILMYLADTYGKDDSWYPKDTKQRGLVNQKLFFDTAILFPRLRNVTTPIILEGAKSIPQEKIDAVDEAYSFMEQFLSNTKYIAGDHITIADLSAISDITSLVYILDIDPEKYPKTFAWKEEMEQKPYCIKHNSAGAKSLGDIITQFK